jgi:PAS domain S-box-containing protein
MYKPTSRLSFLTVDILDKRYQDSENSFKSIFEKSPTGNLILSKDLVVLQANNALIAMLGFDSENDVANTNILQYVNPAYKTDWLLLQQKLWMQKSPSFTIETCLNKNNGESIWCKLTSIVYLENGQTLGYVIIEDISKKTNDEETIKRSQANLLTILDNADSGYVLYNSKLEIVTFNALAQSFSNMLYSKKLEEGNYLLDYFPVDRHDVLLDVTHRVMQGDNIGYERGFKNATGEDKWMEAKWINVKDGAGKNWGFILASKDITENKVAAIEREKTNAELTQRNKSLEQFTNITSHNLRAPVANIIGLAELIEEMEMDEEEKKEMMDGILLSAKNLNTVIDDINEILQLKDVLSQTKEKINLQQLVNDIKISISGMIHKDNVMINCDFESLENLFSIRSYLYSIFYNMILNSIKYKREGVIPEITLCGKMIGNTAQLTFKDNGKGIDMQRHGNNLFGLYKRFDTSVQGKGLGLFMVKSQIETLNGTINVSSQLGQGTEFTVEFPILET